MRFLSLSLALALIVIGASSSLAGEPIMPVSAHQYFYVDFPRRVAELEYQRRMAEAEAVLVARRVDSYRPFRTGGRYTATYFADQAWQLEWAEAVHRVDCLRAAEADLWRERRIVAESLLAR